MQDKIYDVIVIGAGPGGAPCAALLAKKGLKTLLIEQNNRPGGKAMTVSKKGFRYEFWPVAGSPLFNSRFEEILKHLGLESEICVPNLVGAFYYPDKTGQYRPFSGPLFGPQPNTSSQQIQSPEYAMQEVMKWLGIKDEELPEILRLVAETAKLTPYEIEKMDDITYHEYLSNYNLPVPFYSLLGMQANIVYVLPIDQVAASEFIKTSRDMTEKGAGYYSKGGYGRLFERCVEAFCRVGGTVKFNTRVEKIIIENGRVKGIATNKGIFNSPIVVSNAGIQPTVLKLAGEGHFDKSYINRIKDLVPSLALMGARYFLNKPFFKEASNIAFSDNSYWNTERSLKVKSGEIPEELLVFNVIPSNFDPDLAPQGKQCVLSSTLCPADPEFKNTRAYWKKLDEMMDRIWPGFSDHVEFKENYSTKHVSTLTRDQILPGIGGECIGLGQIAGQCGKYKPSPAAPIQGLFYVGCDAGGYGCGTHQAVDSAFNVSRLVELCYKAH
jgi:prolycopene isomerase